MRAVGQKYGYYTADPKEAWLIDSTMDHVADNLEHFVKPQFAQGEKKTELLFELLTVALPRFLKQVEKRVSGKKFICGDRLTIADFTLGSLLCATIGNENNANHYAMSHVAKAYPGVCAYLENFKNEMKDYLATRPPAPF